MPSIKFLSSRGCTGSESMRFPWGSIQPQFPLRIQVQLIPTTNFGQHIVISSPTAHPPCASLTSPNQFHSILQTHVPITKHSLNSHHRLPSSSQIPKATNHFPATGRCPHSAPPFAPFCRRKHLPCFVRRCCPNHRGAPI